MLSSVGGLDVTNIADGFAKFIVKRTKQELSITFFDKFKEKLKDYPDIQTIFPQTNRALKAIDKEIYMFNAYIQTLRESFEKDLASLPTNLEKIIEKNKEFFEKMPELEAILRSSLFIAQSIQDKQHPGEIIENYDDALWGDCNPNFQAAIKTLKLFSKSLQAKEDLGNYWAPKKDIKKLFEDEQLFEIYLGLIIQKAKIDKIKYGKKVCQN